MAAGEGHAWRAMGALLLLGTMVIVGVGGPVAAQLSAGSLTAAIYPGSCRRPEPTPVYTLNDLTRPDEGSGVRGLPFVSVTELDAALPALQAEPAALIVAREANHPDNAVACGDLNTATTRDGSTMLVGLFEEAGSLHTGIASLTAGGEGTTVEVYVARGLNGGFDLGGRSPFGGADENPEPTVTVAVTLTDDEVTIDRREIAVGSVVEFVVRNEGEERHEAVLEERDAIEEPLEIDEEAQAETEDLAPDEEATFVYTFDELGSYQIADHIGDNYDDGLVVAIEVIEEAD